MKYIPTEILEWTVLAHVLKILNLLILESALKSPKLINGIQNRYNKKTQYFVNVNMYLTLELAESEFSIHKFKT